MEANNPIPANGLKSMLASISNWGKGRRYTKQSRATVTVMRAPTARLFVFASLRIERFDGSFMTVGQINRAALIRDLISQLPASFLVDTLEPERAGQLLRDLETLTNALEAKACEIATRK